jgi:hypothetical protein
MGRDPADTHRIEITYKDGGTVRYIEERGLDRVDISLENKIDGPLPLKMSDQLVETARAELAAAGEQTDLDIFGAVALTRPDDSSKATSDALREWVTDICERRTILTRLSRAAQFLGSRGALMLNLRLQYLAKEGVSEDVANEAAAMARMESASFFADAWYFWRREVDGTHAVACSGLQAAASLNKGPAENRVRKLKQWDIVARAFPDAIDDESVPCKVIAGQLQEMNCALEREGMAPLKDNPAALTKMIERIRAWRRKCREAREP